MKKIISEIQIERTLLNLKLERLKDFLKTDYFQKLENRMKVAMENQKYFMEKYLASLDKRISILQEQNSQEEDSYIISEDIIGSFNPSGENNVEEIKAIAKSFIQFVDKVGKNHRRKALATTKMEEAQMFAVKSLFT